MADIHRKRARLLQEQANLTLILSELEDEEANALLQLAGANVDPQTGKKRRAAPAPPIETTDDITASRARRAILKVIT